MSVLQLLATGNFITVSKVIAKRIGLNESVILGALCSELIYCEDHGMADNGFFPFSIELLQDMTTLKRKTQDKAIENLTNAGLIEQRNFGVPNKRHFRINESAVEKLLQECVAEKVSLSCRDKLDCTNGANCIVPTGQTNINKGINNNISSTPINNNNLTIDDKLEYISNAFNSNQNIKAKVTKIPFMSKRYNDLMLSVETYGFDEVLEAVEHLDDNDFFQTWKPNFDWVVDPNNMIKIIEGNYKHNDKQTGDASKEWLEKWVAEDDEE